MLPQAQVQTANRTEAAAKGAKATAETARRQAEDARQRAELGKREAEAARNTALRGQQVKLSAATLWLEHRTEIIEIDLTRGHRCPSPSRFLCSLW